MIDAMDEAAGLSKVRRVRIDETKSLVDYEHFSRMSTRDVIHKYYIGKIKELLANETDKISHSVQLVILEMEQSIDRNGAGYR